MKQKKLFLLVIPMLLLLSGCGVQEGNLVSGFGQGFWSNFVFIFSWLMVQASLILANNLVFGLIAVTLIVRIAMLPLFKKQIDSSVKMADVQPDLKKLQEKYAGKKDPESKQKLAQETQALYSRHGVNPLAGCWPMLVQMPLLFVFYGAIQNLFIFTDGSTGQHAGYLYTSTPLSTTLPLFGDMGEPAIFFAVLAALTTYFSTKVSTLGQDQSGSAAQTMKMMTYFMPIMILFFGITLPGAMAIYWTVGNFVTIAQTLYFKRHIIRQHRDLKKMNKIAK